MSYYDRFAIKMGKVKEEKKPYVMPKKSAKNKTTHKEYLKIVKEFAKESTVCDIKSPNCDGAMQGLHHIIKRSPSNLLDRSNLLRACNACNTFLENNDKWGRDKGFVKSKFKKSA